jgi:DNA-binding transcriptional ArsR family regulator
VNAYGFPTSSSWDAVADPTRRRVLELLRGGPAAVGELAERLPVSRPAVSQHLRTLLDAGLVRFTKDGTRHVYAIDPQGLGELRAWLDTFWDNALERFKEAAEREGSIR